MKEIEARRARQEAEARARAEATRKEMDALPKAFKTEPFFKLNKPEQPAPAVDQSERPNQTIEGKK